MTVGVPSWVVTGLVRVADTLVVGVSLSSEMERNVAAFIFFFVGLYLVYDGFGKWKTKRVIEDTPTEQVRSVAAGRTELEGSAHSADGTLPAPFTDQECLYVEWKVEEYDEDDESGSPNWRVVASGSKSVPFYLDDGTGRILVAADSGDPDFDISPDHMTREVVGYGRSAPPQIEKFIEAHDSQYEESSLVDNPLGAVSDRAKKIGRSMDQRRFTQYILPVGTDVYVIGSAVERTGTEMDGRQENRLEVTRGEGFDEFLISDRKEEELESHYEKQGPIKMVGGIVVSAACLAFLTGVI